MAFEEEFGVEIPDDAAETILTVGDAVSSSIRLLPDLCRRGWGLSKSRPCLLPAAGKGVKRRAWPVEAL